MTENTRWLAGQPGGGLVFLVERRDQRSQTVGDGRNAYDCSAYLLNIILSLMGTNAARLRAGGRCHNNTA